MTLLDELAGAAPGGHALGAADVARMLGLPEPTPEQVAVIEAPLEPLLVVAGAGSGKTETMSARVVFLIANGYVQADQVLGLTFTRKAAGELSERVRRRLRALRLVTRRELDQPTLVVPTISTYNAYAAGLVADHALRLGIEPSARLLGEAARWQLAHDVVEQWAGDLEVDLAPSTITSAVLDLAGALAEHLVTPDALRAEAARLVAALGGLSPATVSRAAAERLVDAVTTSVALRGRLVDLVEEFTARKRAADVIDFADQVALAARLAREVPEVGAGERARFRVVLLDEYQDTSVAQLSLLRHLFGGAGAGVGHPVTAVGDPHQSIYGWRGASAGGLERFPLDFPLREEAGGPVPAPHRALSTSWRNDEAVLAVANAMAGPLRAAAGATGVTLPELRARPGAGAGEVAAAYLETVEDEARAVAAFVRERRAADGDGPPATAAVLCRKRSQFPVLQAALLEAGLPVEVVGLGGLLSAPEVVDLVAALEAAHDPSRGDSLMRLLTGPRARLGLADLHALAEWSREAHDGPGRHGPGAADVADERSIVDALDALPRPDWVSRSGRALSPAGRARLKDLAGVLRALRGLTFLPVVDLVAEAERLLGLDIEVAARPGIAPATARANLDAFRSVAGGFAETEGGTLGAFLAWLEAAQREERGLEAPVGDMDPGAVQLLTVHAAKGLEWDVVAVPGLVEKTFPMAPRTSGWIKDHGALPTALRGDRASLPDVELAVATDRGDAAARLERYVAEHAGHQLGEERRLAYVALTRARRHLLVTGSVWRDAQRPTAPSVFLTEVVATVGERAVLEWVPDPASPGEDGAPRTPVKPEKPAVEPPRWPAASPGPRHAAVERAAAAVRGAFDALVARAADPRHGGTDGEAPDDAVVRRDEAGGAPPAVAAAPAPGPTGELEEAVELLLEERRRGRAGRSTVALPAHLSASALVRLAADRDAFALQLRRPVPLAPSTEARRGTAFHAWVEQYYGAASLVDVDALPGADDDSTDPLELEELRARFLASEWAGRTPTAVEVDVETPVGGVVLRSRIDAVFPEPDGGVVVVDWKTGRPPADAAGAATRELQLSVYRLAWSRWTGLPVERVRAAFFYVATGTTVRPERLLDAAELEAVLSR